MGKGALVFKGEEKAKRKKKNTKHGTGSLKKEEGGAHGGSSSVVIVNGSGEHENAAKSSTNNGGPEEHSKQQLPAPKVQNGKGQVTTSGTVVTGHNGTEFSRQLRVGDAVLVGGEMRVVTMCLSDISINLSSAFASNIVQPTNFQFISKPRAKPSQTDIARKKIQDEEEQSKSAAGTYASNSELVYRQKTEQGSYRIVKKSLDHDATRGDLLEMRAKRTSDKYC